MKRRDFLKYVTAGAGLTTLSTTGSASAISQSSGTKGVLTRMERVMPSVKSANYAECAVRDDGKYGVLGAYSTGSGSFLFDLSDPWNPKEVHHIDSPDYVRNVDVKFDRRDGLYYRAEEGRGGVLGAQIVDYGYGEGTAENPKVIGRLNSGPTHNIAPHPKEDVLYVTNRNFREIQPGLEIWDVSDPANPKPTGDDRFGPLVKEGKREYLHDMTVDPKNDLLHAAYIGGFNEEFLDAYVIFDISDAGSPEVLGVFDYADKPKYREIGQAGFEMCHYADFDAERGLAIVGDEKSSGMPGGKHIFDIGWKDGSPSNPKHIGFTHGPNAKRSRKAINWTTHNHDVVKKGDSTYLVSGDYKEGVVLYDLNDPTNPTPIMQYRTEDNAENVPKGGRFNAIPFCWGAEYSQKRDFAIASDYHTGLYTFKIHDKTFEELLTEKARNAPDLRFG